MNIRKNIRQLFSFTDYIVNIRTNATYDGAMKEFTANEDGEIFAISAYISANRGAGTVSFFPVINGVAQNGVGQYCTIDSNVRRVYLNFVTPIDYSAGQSLGVRSVTSGFSPNNTSATITLWTMTK